MPSRRLPHANLSHCRHPAILARRILIPLRKNHEQARARPWQRLGSAGGQTALVQFYFNGGVNSSLEWLGIGGHPLDYAQAFALNSKAAELRYPDAVLGMGWFYVGGRGVPRNIRLAQHWYRRSARDGEPQAMFSLGQIAYEAKGYSDARRWFERASNHGHMRSLYWLGKLAWRGHGVPRDHSAAFKLFHRAAHALDPEAIRVLRYLSRRKRNAAS